MKEITKIALGVVIGLLVFALIWNSGRIVDSITGMDETRRRQADNIEANRKAMDAALQLKMRIANFCDEHPSAKGCPPKP